MKTIYIEFKDVSFCGIEIEVSESEYRQLSDACRRRVEISSGHPLHALIEDKCENAELIDNSEFRIDTIEIREDNIEDYGDYD